MFNLTRFVRADRLRRRRLNLSLACFGVIWIVLLVALPEALHPKVPNAAGAVPIGIVVALGGFMILFGPLRDRLAGTPTSMQVDGSGITVNLTSGRTRSFQWAHAPSWFELVDMSGPAQQDPKYSQPSPYYLGGIGARPVWLPSEAVGAILSSAKAAGLSISSSTWQGFRHWPVGTVIYTDARRHYL